MLLYIDYVDIANQYLVYVVFYFFWTYLGFSYTYFKESGINLKLLITGLVGAIISMFLAVRFGGYSLNM